MGFSSLKGKIVESNIVPPAAGIQRRERVNDFLRRLINNWQHYYCKTFPS
jgi:hypothetical protein